MTIDNELRRTKQKLALFEVEGVHGLLSDVIQDTEEYIKQIGNKPLTVSDRIFIGQRVKHVYHKYIQKNSPKDKKQTKLFDS